MKKHYMVSVEWPDSMELGLDKTAILRSELRGLGLGVNSVEQVEPPVADATALPARRSIGILLDAAELQGKKSRDYQNPRSTVMQADYYPSGITTIQEIIWGKILRAKSLLEAEVEPSNESLADTYLDIINYCSFAKAWLEGKVPGQDPTRDMFNRKRKAA